METYRTKEDVPSAEELAEKPLLFFSHDSNAFYDIKCRLLVQRRGMLGYGYWWRLCEILAAADRHMVDISVYGMDQILAQDMGFEDVGDMTAFLTDLASIGLLNIDMLTNGIVSSDRMCANALEAAKKRRAGLISGVSRKGR